MQTIWVKTMKERKSTRSCPALVIPWTVACQAPLSMGFSRQEYWSGWVAIPFSEGSSLPRDQTRVSWIAGRFFTIWATREALVSFHFPFRLMISLLPWLKTHALMKQMAQSYRARPVSESRAVVLVASIHRPGKPSLTALLGLDPGHLPSSPAPPGYTSLLSRRNHLGLSPVGTYSPLCLWASCSCSCWPLRPP